MVGPSRVNDPLIIVVPSLLRKVLISIPFNPSLSFLSNLSMLDIDHSIIIPPYFNDQHLLIYLAFLLYPELGG